MRIQKTLILMALILIPAQLMAAGRDPRQSIKVQRLLADNESSILARIAEHMGETDAEGIVREIDWEKSGCTTGNSFNRDEVFGNCFVRVKHYTQADVANIDLIDLRIQVEAEFDGSNPQFTVFNHEL